MKNTIFKSTLIIFLLTLVGKGMGFLKSMLIASNFGANNMTDAYYLASGINSNVFYAVTMSVSLAFVPFYIKTKENDGEESARIFSGNVIINMIIISSIISLMIIFVAPVIVKITASSYEGEQFKNATIFLQIMAIGIVFSLVSDIMQNLLNAERIYGYAAISSIVNSCVLIFAVLFFGNKIGVWSIVFATPFSYLIQFLFLKFRSKKYVKISVKKYGIKDEKFLVLIKQAMPIFFSNATIELNQMIDRILLVSIVEGAVTALSYAAVLFQFVAHILCIPISTVTYTEISQACVKKDMLQVERLLRRALKIIFLIGLPIAIVIFMVPTVIVDIIYGRGAYDIEAVLKTASGLKYYAFCLIPYCVKQVYTKAFYSMENTKSPMKIGIIEVCVNIISSVILAKFFGIVGVVMGTAIASSLFSIVLIILFHKKYITLNIKSEKKDIFKISFSFLIVLLIAYIFRNNSTAINNVLFFVLYVVLVIGLYGLILLLEKQSELYVLIKGVGKKITLLIVMFVMICIGICMYLFIGENMSDKDRIPLYEYNSIMEYYIPENMTIEESIEKLWNDGGNHSEIALILRAECNHYETEPNERSKEIIETITNYLIENAYVAGDGKVGYGMNGTSLQNTGASVIYDNTVYTIQTAEVALAFLDVLDISDDTLDINIGEVKNILYELTVDYGTDVFTEKGDNSYYAYSNAPEQRDMEVVNTSCMLAGAYARIIYNYPELFTKEETDEIVRQLELVYKSIISEKLVIDGVTQWKYCKSNPDSSYNDSIHMAFIYEGLVNLSLIIDNVSVDDVYNSLNMLFNGDEICEFPICFEISYQQKARLRGLGSIMWIMNESDNDKAMLAFGLAKDYKVMEYLENPDIQTGIQQRNEVLFYLYGLSCVCFG